MARRYALIGRGISYSRSPEIWQDIWQREGITDCSFEIIDTDKLELTIERFRIDSTWLGVMVTTPYKERVLPLLDDYSTAVREIGAVNMIAKVDGRLVGYNTDVFGFLQPLNRYNIEGRALVLGSGGACKAVSYALESIGMDVIIVSRTPSGEEIGYDEVNEWLLASISLIVNATPLGGPLYPDMYPSIPYQALSEKHILYDLSYSSSLGFLANAPDICIKIDGKAMLHYQAEEANRIFQSLSK